MPLHPVRRAVLAAAATLSLAGAAGAAHAAPQQPTPAQTLVGQRAAVCYGTNRFDVLVQAADWQRAPAGHVARGNANWAIALVSATNLATDTGILAETVQLRDERGRVFRPSADPAATGDIASAYGVKAPYDLYEPGITEVAMLAFEVAPDAQRLSVTSSNFQCRA